MEAKLSFLCLAITLLQLANLAASTKITISPKNREFESLDPNGKYLLEYEVNQNTSTITFNVLVETIGFVGFGLSPNGGMAGADIIIGGVFPNGTAYFSDRHGVGFVEPAIDEVQSYNLLEAWENTTHTFLSFSRLLDTCDTQDYAINDDTVSLIWSFGATDTISYHGQNRGSHSSNLLDPPMPPFDPEKYKKWQMTVDYEMPSEDTTYYCSTQKSPLMASKHHIVGFRPYLNSPEALRHSHHFIIHKCRAPNGQNPDDFFEPYVNGPGGDCYKGPTHEFVPLSYCQSYLFVWAIGGKMMTFPEHVGYPIGENGDYDYFLLEVHYDNPNELSGLKFETGLELFYTDDLREQDAGTLTLGLRESFSLTVPPNVTDFVIAGHCSSQCSSQIPAGGINIFNVLLHSHLAGRKLKIRHYRNGTELPWLAVDNNYDFNHQQNRPFNPEAKILPRDHLTYECTYDSSVFGRTVIGGLSSTDEMCNTFLLYYPRIPLEVCQTEFPRNAILAAFGIESVSYNGVSDPLVLAPPNMAGKTYTEVLNTMIPWTPANVAAFQEGHRFGEHNERCVSRPIFGFDSSLKAEARILEDPSPRVTYPIIDDDYVPPNPCV